MKSITPQQILKAGGWLLVGSGLLNLILGFQIGALTSTPYPGGRMGHVGVLDGLAAAAAGLSCVYYISPLSTHRKRRVKIPAGFLTLIAGHIGAGLGALYVGTAGIILCYVAGFWLLIQALRQPADNHQTNQIMKGEADDSH